VNRIGGGSGGDINSHIRERSEGRKRGGLEERREGRSEGRVEGGKERKGILTMKMSPSMSLPLHFIIPVTSNDLRRSLRMRLMARENGERRDQSTRDEGRGTKGVMTEKSDEGTFWSKQRHCEENGGK